MAKSPDNCLFMIPSPSDTEDRGVPAGRRVDGLQANDQLGYRAESEDHANVVLPVENPFVLDSRAAQRTFGLAPTPWEDILAKSSPATSRKHDLYCADRSKCFASRSDS
jgi:hypothetical protein